MLHDREKISIVDQEGVEKELIILTSFESEITKKKYLLCINDKQENQEELSIVPLLFNEKIKSFEWVADEKDFAEIKRVLDELAECKKIEGEGDNDEQ